MVRSGGSYLAVRQRSTKRKDQILLLGAPLALLVYYVAFLVILNEINGPSTASAEISPVPFTEEVIDPFGSSPTNIHAKTIGDLNGDGLPDIIAAGAGTTNNGLFWYQNPSWTKHTIVPDGAAVGGFSTDMQVGDIDGDGDLDIVIPEANSAGGIGRFLRWYENPGPLGDPVTDPWQPHAIGEELTHDVELADMNNDGKLDVVGRFNRLWLYLQNDAVADDWTAIRVNSNGQEGLGLGDYDNDGDIDMATSGYWLENPLVPDGEAAMDSTWAEWTIDSGRAADSKVNAADINQDGQLDVVINTSEQAGGELAWYEPSNPSDATQGPWTKHSIGFVDYDHSIQTADVDLNGTIDVIVAEMHQSSGDDNVLVFYNLNGAGTSWDFQIVDTDGSHNIRAADIDLDGDIDIMGANWANTELTLWRNGLTLLDQWERHVIDSSTPWRGVFVDHGDINGDNLPDVVTGGWWYQNPGSPGGVWQRFAIGDPLNNMAAVYDFDGDGDLDVLGTEGKSGETNPNMLWAQNDGSGNFSLFFNVDPGVGRFLQGSAVDQFSPGGPIEVALSWIKVGSDSALQMLTVPADPTTETWTRRDVVQNTAGEALDTGDINGDGLTDILIGSTYLNRGKLHWARNDGGGLFTLFEAHASSAGMPDRLFLVDMDKDGDLDAAVGYGHDPEGKLAWYEQGADPEAAWTEHIIANIVDPQSLDVADMDQDGDPDLVVGEHNQDVTSDSRLFVYENTDSFGGTWKEHIVYTGDEHHDGAHTADLDFDGDLDIISIGWTHGRVHVYENQAGARTGFPIANPDNYITQQDTALTANAPGVLVNDSTPGSGITTTLVSGPSNGGLSFGTDGSFVYTPTAGFTGSDLFMYSVSNDAGTSAPTVVNLTITQPNNPPTGVNDVYSVSRGGLIQVDAPGVLNNDNDLDGDPLSAQLVTPTQYGQLSFNTDGSFEYINFGGSPSSDSFTYIASDGIGESATTTVSISITIAMPRETNGLVALYSFDENTGNTVGDSSTGGPAVDLIIQDPAATSWKPGALSVDSGTLINSGTPATEITGALTATDELTLEAWIKPAQTSQSGPARIVTLSSDIQNRNFTIGQDGSALDVRLRTTGTGANGVPSTSTPGGTVNGEIMHVVYTRATSGDVTIYVNGIPVQTDVVSGDLSSWDSTYQFGLANEISSLTNPDHARTWLGEYWLVAVYDAALNSTQVAANYVAGPETPEPGAPATIEGTVSLLGVVTGSNAFSLIAPQVTVDSGSGPQLIAVALDGTFSIPVVAGTYTITVEAPGFVAMQRSGQVVSTGTIVMPTVELKPGLVNSDNDVTGIDISLVLSNIGIQTNDRTNGIDSNIVDLDGDGTVTWTDYGHAFTSFGLQSPDPDW